MRAATATAATATATVRRCAGALRVRGGQRHRLYHGYGPHQCTTNDGASLQRLPARHADDAADLLFRIHGAPLTSAPT